MVVVWRGAGIAVVLVTLVMMGLVQAGSPDAYRQGAGLGAAFLLSGLVLLPLGLFLNRSVATVVQVQSGRLVEVKAGGGNHTLYGLRMEFWAVLLAGVGLWKCL